MDIERKAEIAGTVLKWAAIPCILGCDLFTAFGMLWLPLSRILIPLAALAHCVILFRKRDAIGEFLFWGIVPPVLVMGFLALISALGAFPRVGM